MQKKITLLLGLLAIAILYWPLKASSQVAEVRSAVYSDVSIPLRDMKPVKNAFWKKWTHETEKDHEVPNKFRNSSPLQVVDEAVQSIYNNNNKAAATAPLMNFNGLTNGNNTSGRVTPPDPAGDVGPSHYVQAVNCMLQIFSKTGTSMYGPVTTSTLWNGFTGNWDGHNDGDAIVLYDETADRWVISQFAVDCGSYPSYTEYQLVAVSTTPDPLGSYYRYAFQFDYMPDYGKLGVWGDGYYMAINRFNTNNINTPYIGVGAVAMQRSKMLTGDPTASMVYFKTETLGGSGSSAGSNCWAMLPSDCDGTQPPAGTPNYFIYDDQASSELRIWALHADWTTPTNSTFTYVTKLTVSAFTELGNSAAVAQQGTTQKLDGLGDRMMFRNQYRNFGTYESFLACRSVTVSSVAALRWYEIRKTGSTFAIYQQSTYAPGDGKNRWMPSIAMNGSGDIGIAYSVSNSTMYPSIYFTGRKAADALNTLTIPEGIIQTGTVAMTGASRWGDYTAMNVDPTDNQTFWTAQEYVGTYGGTWPWATKIASFKFANTPLVTTLPATAITGTSATLNGTVNPNGNATTYHFEWGTTTSYGTNTATVSAGSGTADVAVNAPISGLTGGITYHFRLVGVNSEGTTNGSDLTFTPGAATVTTAVASAITLVSATSGGNVVSDGGSAVTARGVCWATTANPIATGNHTTDGSGTGTFTSSITGLSSNTTYHVRAYATNANGTYYGDDLAFSTLCGIYTLPFTESFSGTTIPTCWSQVDNQGGGQVWQFGTITSQTPNPVLTGNYAYLNSDAYGSGSTQNADLITPTLNLSGYSTVTLAFSHYFKSWSSSSGTLSYSINNGSTWTVIATYTTTSATNPVAFSQAIAAVAGQSAVKFKWNYTGTYGYSWAIDNISITGTSAVTLTVTPGNQNVTAAAGTTPFTVTTTAAWTATSDAAWCTVTPSGTGNGTLTATYTLNSGASRVANITVAAPGATSVVVTVTQTGATPTLSVTPSNQNVTAPAGNTSFTVTSNSAWTVSSNAAWCTVTPSGTGNGTITATYIQNTLLTSRVANVTVTVVGLTPIVVTVTQAAGPATLSVTPSNQNVSAVAGNTNFAVTSNSPWTTSSNAAWCTVTPSGTGDGTIVATYTANALLVSRVATITVTVTGLTPVAVTVTQSGSAPTLSVTPSNQNVTSPAGNTSFTLTSNSAWTVSSSAAWCTVTPSGTGNGTVVATYLENTALTSRIANVTVTVAGLTPIVVTVTQAAATPSLVVTPVNIDVPATAGVANYTVTTNAPAWTATSNTFWCNVTPSGTGSGTMAATYEANTSLLQRISYLAVSVPGAPNANITLTQAAAAPFLIVDPHAQSVGYAAGSTNFAVSSNLTWTIVSDAPWCTVTGATNGNGTVVATFTENTFAANRTANITISASGITPLSTTVTVTQQGPTAAINVFPATRTVTDPAGSTTFAITANTSWTCSSNASWCVPTTSGTGSGTITATYQQNLTQVIRTANIVVTGVGTVPATIQVIQLPSFVSVGQNPESNLQVYPNPSTGQFIISSASNEMLYMRVTIIDSEGRTILTKQCSGEKSYSIDLSQSAKGNYFMRVDTGRKVSVIKVIVE